MITPHPVVAPSPEGLEALSVQQLAALAVAVGAKILEKTSAPREEDRLITVEEAAELTGLTPRYIRRESARLPFTRKPSPGKVMCSALACRRFINRPRE